MRSHYLVAYDISDPKRLRRMFRIMRGYGDPLQLSVFLCYLSDKERVLLTMDISAHINHLEDRVSIVNLGSSGVDKKIRFIGRRMAVAERTSIIV